MNKTPRLGHWWPVVFGVAIGVEMTLSALVLSELTRLGPEVLRQLTSRGFEFFHPEHDVAIYASGCVLTILFVGGFSWLWQRRFTRVSGAARDEFIRQSCAQLSVAAVLFLLHAGLLRLIHGSITEFGLQQRQTFGFETATPLTFAVCILAVPVIASLMVATLCPLRNLGIAPRRLVAHLGASPAVYELPVTSFHRGFDVLMPVLLGAAIYIPAWRLLAGQLFLRDEFHHWDFFAMGPALAFQHGKALGTDFYTQYGVGWPMLAHLFSSLIPITYGRLIHAAVVYGCVYFIGIYVFLRLLLGRAVWAAAGVLFALSLQMFHGLGATDVLWLTPSSTVLRYALDVWFFIALLLHLRTDRAMWGAVAGAVVGMAILIETDTGISLAVGFVAYWIFRLGIVRKLQPPFLRRRPPALISLAVTVLVLLAGLAIASRGTLWHMEFWAAWLVPLMSYSVGMGMYPIAIVDDGTLLLFTGMIAVYLGAVGLAVVKLLRRESTPADVLVGCLASYGLLVLILFVGRSTSDNIFKPSVPFALVVAVMATRLHQGLKDSSAARREGVGRVVCHYQALLLPWCALGGVVIWLLANPAFQNYPGMWRPLFARAPEEGLCLLREPRDICGLPAEKESFVRDFDATVSSLRACAAARQTVAVLDDNDTIFYLAAGVPPWWRYSPCFPAIMRRSELVTLQRAILSRGPQCILIRPDSRHAQSYYEEDVWYAVHQTIESCYQREGATGLFEIWRRNDR